MSAMKNPSPNPMMLVLLVFGFFYLTNNRSYATYATARPQIVGYGANGQPIYSPMNAQYGAVNAPQAGNVWGQVGSTIGKLIDKYTGTTSTPSPQTSGVGVPVPSVDITPQNASAYSYPDDTGVNGYW
jgi:hypothetical protein